VPLVDARLFASASEHRATLNLGGIANLTILPAAAAPEGVLGFDSGPANMLVDAYCMLRSGGNEHYDRDGARALHGRVDEQLLTRWLAHPYFASPPPKSTGREQFGAAFLTAERQALDILAFDDAIATLTALSVRTIAAALLRVAPRTQRMIASGGGVHNGALMSGLRAALPDITLETSSAYGIDPDAKEAIAFALLGYEALRGRALPLASVTGARGARVLGAIAPVELSALIGRLQAEEGAND
jgi:anhydro-N-acetylmuramic acid kinase